MERSTISERSTLSSFRSPSSSPSFRGGSSEPNEPRGGGNYQTNSHTSYGYGGGYYGGGYYGGGYYGNNWYRGGCSSGWSWGWNLGFHWGWGSLWLQWNYPGYFYYPQYFTNHHWHIHSFHGGWFGFNWGHHCSYWPWHSFRHHHRYCYRGSYYRICRPYWYGFARWYDYSPYRYSYVTLNYDSLDDDDYDDGYGDGYNRGYEDGADETGAYQDDRRRDSIGKPRPRVPDSEIDRKRTDASAEYTHEMTRGTDAFNGGDYKTATKSFKEAVILSPESSDARYSLAISAFAEGKYSFSAFALRRGVALDAKGSNIDVPAVFKDAAVFKSYVDKLNAELADNPDDADLLLLSGYIALRSGDAKGAAEKLDRATQAAPQDAAAKTLHREAMDALENE